MRQDDVPPGQPAVQDQPRRGQSCPTSYNDRGPESPGSRATRTNSATGIEIRRIARRSITLAPAGPARRSKTKSQTNRAVASGTPSHTGNHG